MNGFCLRKDLDSKLTLSLYKTFFETTHFKCYLDGGSDAVLMLKFKSGTHGFMRSSVDKGGRKTRSVYFVMMNVRVLVTFVRVQVYSNV